MTSRIIGMVREVVYAASWGKRGWQGFTLAFQVAQLFGRLLGGRRVNQPRYFDFQKKEGEGG